MKITANQYAKTLFELTDGKTEKEVNEIIPSFFKVVKKNRQGKLFLKILEGFNKSWNKNYGIFEVQVISREELDEEMRKKIADYVKKKYGAKEVVIDNKIDESIKGGIILKIGDEILDASVERQLVELRKSLIKF